MDNKSVVIIMPQFHDYADRIETVLRKKGYEPKTYFETPGTISNLVIKRFSNILGEQNAYHGFNKRLFNQIAAENKQVSRFVVIRGNILEPELLKNCINSVLANDGKEAYYSWDSFSNLDHGSKLGEMFENRFSFDSEDVKHNPGWKLLPLFYSDEYNQPSDARVSTPYEYDLCCVTGLSLQKYELYQKVKKANPDLKICCRMYIDKKLLKTKKIMDSRFRDIEDDIIITESMSSKEIIDLYQKGKAILDLPSSSQTGLSMRTIESIGLRKKLVTSNKFAKEYDFYSEGNIWILEDNYKINSQWFEFPYSIDENIRNHYSIESWTDQLFLINERHD